MERLESFPDLFSRAVILQTKLRDAHAVQLGITIAVDATK